MLAPSRHGFTLIELSIVLVIIGLIVGGVMAGKTLIQQAEIRVAASQLEKLETAYRTFQLKYECIPGDCLNATDYFGLNYVVVAAGCPPSGGAGNGNGNGDGFIDNAGYGGGNWTCEPTQALRSLYLSNFLPTQIISPCRPGSTVYFKAMNDSCGYFFKDDLYSAATSIKTNGVTMATFVAGNTVNGAALSPVQARLIDEKIDNGNPLTGKFRGLMAAPVTGGAMVANSCETSGVYNLNEDYTCRALYYFK